MEIKLVLLCEQENFGIHPRLTNNCGSDMCCLSTMAAHLGWDHFSFVKPVAAESVTLRGNQKMKHEDDGCLARSNWLHYLKKPPSFLYLFHSSWPE